MHVRWQYRRRRSRLGREPEVHWAAILVGNKRVKGKPTQRHLAYLVGFTEGRIKGVHGVAARCNAWDRVLDCLDGLKIDAADRKKIEAAIAGRLPRPTASQYRKSAKRRAELLGDEYLTDRNLPRNRRPKRKK
jgi:hypothetical protein